LALAFVRGMVRELLEMVPPPVLAEIERIVASGNTVRKTPLVLPVIEREFSQACRVSGVQEEAVLGAARAACVGLDFCREEDIQQGLNTFALNYEKG